MTKNESKLLSLQWIAKTSAFCLLLSAFSVNAAMAVPASVGTVDEVMGVQQDKKVTGTVVDEAGIPVIGANVIQKGTTNGVITDLDGNFSLEIPNGAVIGVFIDFHNVTSFHTTARPSMLLLSSLATRILAPAKLV